MGRNITFQAVSVPDIPDFQVGIAPRREQIPPVGRIVNSENGVRMRRNDGFERQAILVENPDAVVAVAHSHLPGFRIDGNGPRAFIADFEVFFNDKLRHVHHHQHTVGQGNPGRSFADFWCRK